MDLVQLLGLFCVFMCPMIFGAITFIYSVEVTKDIGKE